jgi:hypothetical protein
VEISPSGKPSARALRTRRIIFPLRVFGSDFTNSIFSGFAIGPTSWETYCRNVSTSVSDAFREFGHKFGLSHYHTAGCVLLFSPFEERVEVKEKGIVRNVKIWGKKECPAFTAG